MAIHAARSRKPTRSRCCHLHVARASRPCNMPLERVPTFDSRPPILGACRRIDSLRSHPALRATTREGGLEAAHSRSSQRWRRGSIAAGTCFYEPESRIPARLRTPVSPNPGTSTNSSISKSRPAGRGRACPNGISAAWRRRIRRWSWCSSSCRAGIRWRRVRPSGAAVCAGSRSSEAGRVRSAGLRGGCRSD